MGPVAGSHLRQDVPAHVRGVPRARSAHARRGVPPALRAAVDPGPDAVRARAWAASGAGGASASGARSGRSWSCSSASSLLLGALYLLGVVWGDSPDERDADRSRRPRRRRPPRRPRPSREDRRRRRRRRPRGRRCGSPPKSRACTCASSTRPARRSSTASTWSPGKSTKTFRSQRFRVNFGNGDITHARGRQALPGGRSSASRSATRCARGRSRRGSRRPRASSSAPRERTRGHHRHRHRGAVGDHPRRQRAVAVRGAAGAWRRGLAHRRRGRPAGRPALRARLPLRRRRPGRHERRARADRGRSDGRRRGRVGGRGDAARPGAGGADLGRRLAAAAADAVRRGGDAGGRAQAGARARRRRRAGAGRDRAGSAGVGASGRWSRCCRGRRASCRRCGRRRSRPRRCASCWSRRGRWSSGSCASSRCPSRRSRRRCASSTPTRCRWRSRRACGAASSRSRPCSRPRDAAAYASLEAALRERHGDVLFSDDGATIDEVVARLLAGRTIATAESCTGGLMAGRLTDLAGSSAYVLGGLVVYSNEAKTALAGVPAVADRGPRRGLARGGDRVVGGRALALGGGLRHRHHRHRRPGRRHAGEAGRHRLPVGLAAPRDAEERVVRLPGGRADVRDRTTTVALHMLRALLLRA